MKHVFNWHKEPKDSFLRWAVVHFLPSPTDANYKTDWKRLEDATDKWSNVELSITLNGVEVDAKKFMERIHEERECAIKRGVEREIAEIPSLDELNSDLHDFRMAVIDKMHDLASKHGLRIAEGGY